LKLDHISAHTLLYVPDFRVMLSAHYENNVYIWNFEGTDCCLLNKLQGHNSQVTAIQVIKDSPMILTADEIGHIKTWDIRSLKCIQTFQYECKSSFNQFIIMSNKKFMGIEHRFHWFEFEDKVVVN
jgi:WD40 repeat protein